jgi:hypothetical protein
MPELSSPERAGRRGHLGAVRFIFFMFWILSTEELPERESMYLASSVPKSELDLNARLNSSHLPDNQFAGPSVLPTNHTVIAPVLCALCGSVLFVLKSPDTVTAWRECSTIVRSAKAVHEKASRMCSWRKTSS